MGYCFIYDEGNARACYKDKADIVPTPFFKSLSSGNRIAINFKVMKKKVLFLGVLLFVLTASVNAQVYVGGTLGISAENYKTEGKSYTNSVYSISPEIGYNINQHWAVGASLGLFYSVSGGGGDAVRIVSGVVWLQPAGKGAGQTDSGVAMGGDGDLGSGVNEV